MVDGDLIITDETSPPFDQELEAGKEYDFVVDITYELDDGVDGYVEVFFPDTVGQVDTVDVTGSGSYEDIAVTHTDTPPEEDAGGTFYISAILYDSNDEFVEGDDETWDIGTDDNSPPTIDSFSPSDEAIDITQDNSIDFEITASDPDDSTLDLSWHIKRVSDDTYTQLASESGTTSQYTHTFTETGDFLIKAEASDGTIIDDQVWTIVVSADQGEAPTFQTVSPSDGLTLTEGDTQQFSAEITDTDDDLASVTWSVNGTPQSTTDIGSTSPQEVEFSWTFREAGEYTVEVVVEDAAGNTAREQWNSITVETATGQTPDVAITESSMSPSAPDVGDSVSFQVTVANVGDAPAEGFNLLLEIGEDEFRERGLTVAANGETVVDIGDWIAVEDDTPYTITADPTGELQDSNLGNNTLSDTVQIGTTQALVFRSFQGGSVELDSGRTVSDSESIEFADGERVTLTANPDDGYEFSRWRGEYPTGEANNREITLTMDQRVVIKPVFRNSNPSGDLTLQTIDATGSRVDGVEVSIVAQTEAVETSSVSRGGEVTFQGLPAGMYSVSAEASQLNQQLEREVYVASGSNDRALVFDPAEPIHGIVLDQSGTRPILAATVGIPELNIQTRTDDGGQFLFSDQIPDGEYKLTVTPSEGPQTAESIEVGLNRTVRLTSDIELEMGTETSSEVTAEENPIINIAARNVAQRDLGLPVFMPFAYNYGGIKGAVTALVDFVDGLADLLDIDISEFIDTLLELFELIADDPGILLEMVVVLFENLNDKQQADNPFGTDTPNYVAFQSGWLIAYGVVTVAIEILIGKGVGRASQLARSSSTLQKGVSGVKRMTERADGLPTSVVLGTRKGQLNLGGRNSKATGEYKGIFARAANQKVVKRVTENYHKLQRETKQDVVSVFSDAPNKPFSEFSEGTLKNIKGAIGEIDAAVEILRERRTLGQLPATGTFRLVKTVEDLTVGETALLNGYELNNVAEIDLLVVTKVVPDGQEEPILAVRSVWEVTTDSKAAGEKAEKVTTKIGKLRDELASRTSDPDGSPPAQLPLEAFDRRSYTINGEPIDVETRTIGPADAAGEGFDATLPHTSDEYAAELELLYNNRDELDLQ